MNLCIFVIGAKRTGKTTFGTELAKKLGCRFYDTSAEIRKEFKRLTGLVGRLPEKETIRPQLIALGDVMCSQNPARLVEMILEKDMEKNHEFGWNGENPTSPTYTQSPAIVIGGIRRLKEFRAAKEEAALQGFTCVTLTIERGLPPDGDNYELQNVIPDYRFDNWSTFDRLNQKAGGIAAELQSMVEA